MKNTWLLWRSWWRWKNRTRSVELMEAMETRLSIKLVLLGDLKVCIFPGSRLTCIFLSLDITLMASPCLLTPPVLSLLQGFSVLNLVSTWIFMFVSAKRRVQRATEHLSGMACARGGQGLVHRWRDCCWAPLYELTSVAVFGSRNTHISTHCRRE